MATSKTVNVTTIAFLVQGPAEALPIWIHRLGAIASPDYNRTYGFASNIKLIYASYDRPTTYEDGAWMCNGNVDMQDEERSFTCQTSFLPKSTWTEGRNALTRLAWCDPDRDDFIYWVFADEDIQVQCQEAPGEAVVKGLPCWERYLHYLEIAGRHNIPYVPANMRGISYNGMFKAVSRMDAALNAFHYKYVTQLLPYAYLPPGSSQHSSQAILFMIIETCFFNMGIVLPGITATNPVHRDYPQGGLTRKVVHNLTKENYERYVPFIQTTLGGQQNGQGNLSSWDVVVAHISSSLQSNLQKDPKGICERGLQERFFNFLNRTDAPSEGTKMCDPLPYENDFF